VFAVFNDFAYAPLTANGSWFLRNISVLLENMPFVRKLAGSILLHAQKPPRTVPLLKVSLCDHPQLRNKVSVVVPCHNEEMNLRPLVTRLMDLFGDYLHEIVLVDDNSKDNTRKVITELVEQYPLITPVFRTPPNGVGRAIMDGYRAASGKYILSMDCDFQHLLPELRDLFDAAAEGYDAVIGSRFSRRSVLLNYPFQKIAANRGFHLLARIFLHTGFRDVTNNLKLLRREVVEKMELTQPGFSINAETGLLPIMMGFSFKEVPISWINRTPDMGVSSFKLVQVGGGYWQVLYRLWMRKVFRSTKYYANTTIKKSNISPKAEVYA
jgi:glycosyltransferase involved in cell wall biosynthesis